MDNITLGEIARAIGTITAIAVFFIAIFSFYKRVFVEKIAHIEDRIKHLEADSKRQDKEIETSKEERLLLLKSELACLKGLKEQGCDGAVSEAIISIENYLITKAH